MKLVKLKSTGTVQKVTSRGDFPKGYECPLNWLFDNLEFTPDEDEVRWDYHPVKACVYMSDDGHVYDIHLNSKSVGFLALKTIVPILSGMEIAPVLDEDSTEGEVYELPYFGEIA